MGGGASTVQKAPPAKQPAKVAKAEKRVEDENAGPTFVIVSKDHTNIVVLPPPKEDKVISTVVPFRSEGSSSGGSDMRRKQSSQNLFVTDASSSNLNTEVNEMDPKERDYWKSLNTSTKRKSWMEFELAAIIGMLYAQLCELF